MLNKKLITVYMYRLIILFKKFFFNSQQVNFNYFMCLKLSVYNTPILNTQRLQTKIEIIS